MDSESIAFPTDCPGHRFNHTWPYLRPYLPNNYPGLPKLFEDTDIGILDGLETTLNAANRRFYEQHVKIGSLEDAIILEESTTLQRQSELYMRERLWRLTSSKFYDIMIRQADVHDTFLKRVLDVGGREIRSASLRYGRQTEPLARNIYIEITEGKWMP